MTPASCRLHVLLAAGSPRAVVIRRGPSKLACLVAWDRSNDTFEVGQWFKGRIHEDRCDLSEDGTLMVAHLASQRPPLYSWTVLCRPPYLTALALWPRAEGGRFVGQGRLSLRGGSAAMDAASRIPDGLVLDDRTNASPPSPPRGPAPSFGLQCGADGYAIERDGERLPLGDVDWAGIDRGGDLLMARGGTLLRLPARRIPRAGGPGELLDRARVLVDLAPLAFRPLAAPYERARPLDAPPPDGSPRLDRVTREDRRARRALRRS